MGELPPPHLAPPLPAVLDAAKAFGLSDEEVWQGVDAALQQAGSDATLGESLDDVIAVLAGRILAKERRRHAGRRRALDEDI